jgi:hypothetical protein
MIRLKKIKKLKKLKKFKKFKKLYKLKLKKLYKKNTNHKYLCYTNLLLVISIFYFLYNRHKIKSIIEYILAFFLIIIIIFSQLFWNNPIKSSCIHKIDAIIAKIGIISFISYTIIKKFKFSFIPILLAIFIASYLSNYYSKQLWCSNKHLISHGSLHILCFIATFYTFTPK